MDALLLNPPYRFPNPEGITRLELFQPSVGLASVAAYANRRGIKAEYHDFWNKSFEDLIYFIKHKKPKIVGITCLTSQHLDVKHTAEIIRETDKDTNIIVGGPHASVLDERVLLTFPVDFVVRGEGEVTFYELSNALINGLGVDNIKGITYKSDGHILRTGDRELIEDLDSLGFADYSHCDFSQFKSVLENEYYYKKELRRRLGSNGRLRFAPVCSSRGCVNQCDFCYSSFWRGIWRARSAENVVDEIVELKERYQISHITFTDDSFMVDMKRAETICQLLLDRKVNITFDAAVRVAPISLDVIKLMKEAGCVRISFGVESGSQRILDKVHKNITVEQIIKAFELTHRVGIPAFATIMGGNPGETQRTIHDTIGLLKIIRPDGISCNPAIALPGTKLYQISKIKGILWDGYWDTHPEAPLFEAEQSRDKVRYFQKQILLGHAFFSKDYRYALKYFIIIVFLRLALFFKVDADSLRNKILSFPFAKMLIKRFPQ